MTNSHSDEEDPDVEVDTSDGEVYQIGSSSSIGNIYDHLPRSSKDDEAEDDRWILPLRESRLSDVREDGEFVTLDIEPAGRIRVGLEAVFQDGPFKSTATDDAAASFHQQGLGPIRSIRGAHLLSTVCFKSGTLRVVFEHGWFLLADETKPVPAEVEFEEFYWIHPAGFTMSDD